MEGYYFENADQAMEFYERCEQTGATTYEAKMIVLKAMAAENKAKRLRDVEGFTRGHKILKITPKGETR